ncbi:class I SAM-dependent methyltransferase [Paenarthrobacter sp. PH39-S1]|uniref:class I SAM-dependent methyltransferase n=1 Tax=Paenarthrobacter sp. PH39-S1 TaxID=3046204 RepID=UPI0024B9B37B|nr:class I SAM-dependent methyltransferase [Paenarthrobacter sp. PH39-S1]MDJ0355413.1 class I SAM-dependent methyltransferase [Paenarthrobacter sp. PH39-S1]
MTRDFLRHRAAGDFLRHRATGAVEEMDKPDCDPQLLERTYAQFPLINAAVAGWRGTYIQQLRPLLSADRTTTLLDIGCGGGDVPRRLAAWAARDGLPLRITAIDPDERAHAFAAARPAVPRLTFRRAFSSELVAEGATFDLVISNHVLHHLSALQLHGLLADSQLLATQASVHSDIARSPLAYALFSAGTLPVFHRSFIRRDGLTSIRRSYTASELRSAVPPTWRVQPQGPFRNLLTYTAVAHGRVVSSPESARHA